VSIRGYISLRNLRNPRPIFLCDLVSWWLTKKTTIYAGGQKNWCKKCAKSAHFCSFFTQNVRIFTQNVRIFTQNVRIFDHFFLAYFTQTPQLDKLTPVFTPKINIAPAKISQKTLFFLKSG